MAGKYVLQKASNGQYFFNLKAVNGERILTSETYVSKQSANGGIDSCKRNSGTRSNYESRSTSAQAPYFVLKAQKGEVIGKSEMYSSSAARDVGIASCMTNGPTAATEDLA